MISKGVICILLQFTVFLKETVLNMLGLRLAFISHTVSLLIYTGLAASKYLNHQKYSSNPSKIFSIMYDVHTMHPNHPLLSDKKWIRFKIFASILNLFCCQYLNTTKPVSNNYHWYFQIQFPSNPMLSHKGKQISLKTSTFQSCSYWKY